MESIHARTTMLGLTKEQVDASYRQHGGNELESQKRAGFFAKLLANFGDPVIKILLLALAVNIIFLFRNQNWFETMGIAIAIALATLVSTISEYGSESAFRKMQEDAERIEARVMRDGSFLVRKKIPTHGRDIDGEKELTAVAETGILNIQGHNALFVCFPGEK